MAICKRRPCNLFACTSEWLHHPRHGPQLCPLLVLVGWQPQALPRPAAPSCRVRIGTSPASFPQVEARPVATRRSELAACIVANHQHSPTTPSLHVVAACRIASQNTDDRRRAWLAFTHHDASPDTLSSQHEPCGGRGASPTRRRPTSIAALSTVTAARRQTAARCASAGHVSLVAQTWAAMLMRSRKQSSPQGRDRRLGVESRDGKPPPKVGTLSAAKNLINSVETWTTPTLDEAGQAETKTDNSSGAKMRKEDRMVRLFLLDSVLSFLGGMSFRPHTVDFHRGGGGI